MKDIYDAFSDIISKYIDFYMTKKEFDEAWKKVTKEMSIKYKKRGKELCSSKSDVIEWYNIGKTEREVELEKKVKELESKITHLNTVIDNLEYKLSSKKDTESEKIELEKKINRIERKLKECANKEIEACAKENRRFRAYEEYANSIKGISDMTDNAREAFTRDAEERRELEKLERLF